MRKFIAAALCLVLCACPTDMASALREYGYMPVRPASALWQPGALVYVVSRDPFQVGFICTARQVMGPNFRPLESLTSNAELAKASKRGITMAAHVSDIVTADAELQNIKSVKMLLKNVRISEVSDVQAFEAAQHLDKRCARAVRMRREQGFEVTLVAGSITADVTYSVNWSSTEKMDVDAKVAAVQNLSMKLGVDASSTSDKSIAANGLVWGIKDSAYLAWILDPKTLPKVDRGSSIISNDTQSQLEVMLKTAPQPPTVLQDPCQHVQPMPDVEETPEEQAPLPDSVPERTADVVPDLPVPTPRAPRPRNPNRNSSAF